MKRKLAHGNCANCGVDETKTSLWRTGIDRERLCNACGLYVQTHGTPRPTTHFNQRKGKAKEGGASRDSTPSRTPRSSPKPAPVALPPISAPLSSSSSTSSDSLEPSPPITHAVPVRAQAAGRPRQRQPRRPHVSAEGSDTDGGSTSRGHSRVRLPRAPPRPRSAPPTKHRSRFHSPSIDIFRTDKGTAPAILSDVEKLRAAEDVLIREPATDVLSQGNWYRVPEKTIRLDFWSKIGLGPGSNAEGSASMMRTSSAPSYTPRMNVFTPQETMSDSFSPGSTVDDTFGTSGGDFSDSENGNGKRGRYYGPLFNVRQVAAQVAAEKKAGPRSRGSSPSGLDVGAMRIASRRTSEQHGPSQPPSRPGSLPPSSAPTSPQEVLLGGSSHMPESFVPNPHITYPGQLSPDRAHAIPTSASGDGLAAKRMRSSSPSASMQIHPPAPSALIPSSHPSPVHHSAVVSSTSSVQKIARAGSPLRFSSSASVLQHPPLPKSNLGVESVPSDERSVMKADDDGEDVFGGGGAIVPPAEPEPTMGLVDADAKMEG